MREPLQNIKHYISSGNDVLDIILNYKLAEAEKRKIKVEVVTEKLNKMEIDENDLCAIFSNLIDNAIEACEYMENEEKWIRILIKNIGEIMIFNISNSYIGEKEGIKKNIYGEIQSTQKGLHGYGLHSVKTKIEKYGGNLELNFENNTFNAMFTFYNIKNGKDVKR